MNHCCCDKKTGIGAALRRVRIFLFCLAFAAGSWMCADVSLANSPAPARSIVIVPDHVPEEAKYLELLIPMPPDDPCYCDYNQTTGSETGLADQAPIVSYMEGGYISYSFHMKDASSDMKLEPESFQDGIFSSYAFGDNAYAGSRTHLEYIQENFGTMKAALLDKEGNVLAVSEEVSIRAGDSGYLAGTIAYDCASGKLSPIIYQSDTFGSTIMIAVILLIMLISFIMRALFTAVVESVVSLAFRVQPWKTVFWINGASNIIFNLLLAFNAFFLHIPYLTFVAAGEMVVIYAENAVYGRLLRPCGKPRILAFAIAANLVSLLLGLVVKAWLSGAGFIWFAQMI